MGDHEPWNIEINQRYLANRPGEGAREQERKLAQGKSGWRRSLEKVLDVRSDERNWRRGAEGEEEVGRRLAGLPSEQWAVIHDITIGRQGANLDHLVIGPPGIFALNTKHLTGKVTVFEQALLQNGHKTSYVVDSLREARTVQRRLSAAVGHELKAWGVIVLMGCQVDWKQRPINCSVVGRRQLPDWFLQMPRQALSSGEVLELERIARTPSTWTPRSRRQPTAVREGRAVRSAPAPVSPQYGGFVINRWRKYQHDRLYANLPDGRKVGWIDVRSGALTVTRRAYREAVSSALAQARAEVLAREARPGDQSR